MSNSDNPKNGAIFQRQVRDYFERKLGKKFKLEESIEIGFDPDNLKAHRFDVVAEDNSIVIECKRYTWTSAGNVPSAKMGFINEAAFYLSFLPDSYEKYIVLMHSYNEKRNETLAHYYFRINKHLLKDTKIAEYDPIKDEMIIVE